jgi:hypothetical protein
VARKALNFEEGAIEVERHDDGPDRRPVGLATVRFNRELKKIGHRRHSFCLPACAADLVRLARRLRLSTDVHANGVTLFHRASSEATTPAMP